MKLFSRATNSFVITASVLAVIIGALCFSVGEGLRLTPFPNPTISSNQDSGNLSNTGIIGEATVAKYGPLDVPAPIQKRGKRQTAHVASASVTGTRSFFTTVVRSFTRETDDPVSLSFIAPNSGRAPPVQS